MSLKNAPVNHVEAFQALPGKSIEDFVTCVLLVCRVVTSSVSKLGMRVDRLLMEEG